MRGWRFSRVKTPELNPVAPSAPGSLVVESGPSNQSFQLFTETVLLQFTAPRPPERRNFLSGRGAGIRLIYFDVDKDISMIPKKPMSGFRMPESLRTITPIRRI